MARGTYVLVLYLAEATEITVGRLGRFTFTAGYYAYVGSALGGLEVRVNRHLRAGKCLHWHIDYLTAVAPVVGVYVQEGAGRRECLVAQTLSSQPGARLPVRGFGSSDCRCPAHLVWFGGEPAVGSGLPAFRRWQGPVPHRALPVASRLAGGTRPAIRMGDDLSGRGP
ncbi:MAG: GIY-YIG nuclease family protein [Dehalococcoidales bacterium]|nr:GIY-YIG nuclease family protein [Dehalococcoidales bacterium]